MIEPVSAKRSLLTPFAPSCPLVAVLDLIRRNECGWRVEGTVEGKVARWSVALAFANQILGSARLW
jgi:hypothetical protein